MEEDEDKNDAGGMTTTAVSASPVPVGPGGPCLPKSPVEHAVLEPSIKEDTAMDSMHQEETKLFDDEEVKARDSKDKENDSLSAENKIAGRSEKYPLEKFSLLSYMKVCRFNLFQ